MNPILAQTDRNGLVETIHRGSIVVMGPDGPLMELGDPDLVTYPRSAMKFVQVLPLIQSGAAEALGITDQEIALMCGSHNAEPEHLAVAHSILRKAQAHPEDLDCGPHLPLGETARHGLIREGSTATDLHNNCSGKHAGFLALAHHLREPTQGYLQRDHPVQELVRQAVCEVFEMEPMDLHAGTDGCSAPNYGMPLRNMAIGFRNLAQPAFADEALNAACRGMARAVSGHAFMVAGTARYCTDLMNAAGGQVIAKLGADGVYCMGLPGRGIGIAIKLDDGATGPQYNVAQALLEELGVFPEGAPAQLQDYLRTPIYNCNRILTGYRKAVGISD